MGELSPWHWIIVLLIFAVLFGSKKMPDAARGLGRSLRIFKAEMSSAHQDGAAPEGDSVATAPAAAEPVAETPAEATAPAPVEDAVPPQPVVTVPETAEPAAEHR
jgi:sec-independent protein translocase protein TatA